MFIQRLNSSWAKYNIKIIGKFNRKCKGLGSREYCNYNKNEESTSFSLYNIKKTIKLAGYNIEDGFTCIKTTCPVCQLKEDTDIYVNKTTGDVLCPRCQHASKYTTLAKFFVSSKTKNLKMDKDLCKFQELFLKSKKAPVDYEQLIDSNQNISNLKNLNKNQMFDVIEYFKFSAIPNVENILLSLNVKFDSSLNTLYVPLLDVTNKIVGYKELRKSLDENELIEEKTIPSSNTSGVVVCKSSTKPSVSSSKAIVVLNILDVIALMSQKVNATIICLPYNLKSLPPECLPTLECFQKLVLWFDYDIAGWDTARIFSKKLDEKRCYFVRPTDNHLTPYKALLRNFDLKNIFSKAEPILHKAITTFSSLRQDVLSDLQNSDKVNMSVSTSYNQRINHCSRCIGTRS